jgi:nucleotide-binding universal stress UspA family protein
VPIDTLVVRDRPAAALMEHGSTCDMIVAGARGYSPPATRVGPVSQELARRSPVPVVIVRPRALHALVDPRPVVVGIDGSNQSSATLRWAAAAAAARGVPLRIVHARPRADLGHSAPPPGAEDTREAEDLDIQDIAPRLCHDGTPTVKIETVTTRRAPSDALLHQSADAQLLVLGGPGSTWSPTGFLTSVSHRCLLRATCTVAVIRGGHTTTVA